MGKIPASIEDVDAAWLTEALGQPITAVDHVEIGDGLGVSSAVYKATLTGGDPETVVIKLPALAEEAVFTSTMLRMYIREVRFFNGLAADSPLRVPTGYYGIIDEETSQFVQIMEDMSSLRSVDQVVGMSIEDARSAIDGLAKWHAKWWGQAGPLVERGDVVALSDPIYPAVLPVVWAEGWEKLTTEMDIPAEIHAIGPAWPNRLPHLLEALSSGPTTLVHGDYRGDNLFFDHDGSVVPIDFQLLGQGAGAYDLAYFVTQSLTPEVASAHERELFDRWVAGLIAAGVPESDTTDMWQRYREAAYFCLAYPVIASRGMDLDDPRLRELAGAMLRRFGRAIDELNLMELI